MSRHQSVRGRWTATEIRTLTQEMDRGAGYIQRTRDLTGRSHGSVVSKAYHMRRRGHAEARPVMTTHRPPVVWTTTRVADLRALAVAGASRQQAADRLGCSVASVCKAAQAHGIRFRLRGDSAREWTQYEVAFLREAIARGDTRASIARELGRTRKAVNHRAEELGIRTRHKWKEADALRLRALTDQGLSDREIGAKFKTSAASVEGARLKWGIRKRKGKPPPLTGGESAFGKR